MTSTTVESIVPAARAAHPLSLCLVSIHGDPLAPTGAEEAGGQNVYVREVARALAERGHRVDVYTRGREAGEPRVVERHGFRVIQLPAGPVGFVPRTELYPYLPEFTRGVVRQARSDGRRYDLVHTNYWLSGWAGMQLAEAWGIPQLHTHHSLGAVKYGASGEVPRGGRRRLEVEDQVGRRAARVVATSPQEVESLGRLYPSRARTAIIPCGVGPTFRPRPQAACREAFGLPSGPLVAYAGRFEPAKGIDTLVEAIALHPPATRPHLLLVGGCDPAARDTVELRRIQALVSAAGLEDHATFLGRLDHDRLAMAYGAADVVVVPSHYESFGLVAVEAMACGVPVVASEVGGLRYSVVHRETGLLVPARDARAFSAAIALLLADPALARRMGAEGARLVQRLFTWRAVAARLEALYREVGRAGRQEALA